MSDTELVDYVSFRRYTHINYRQAGTIDMKTYDGLTSRARKFVEQDVPTNVLVGISDSGAILDHGIRYLLS